MPNHDVALDPMPAVVERFMRYCALPSQSDPELLGTVPSTPEQFAVAREAAADLEKAGAQGVKVDDHAYVTAWLDATPGLEELPCLGLIAHLDTAWQANGAPVRPRTVVYEGGALVMGEVDGRTVQTTPEDNPRLASYVGEALVVTDGTSLLGGDDKAGMAEIVCLVERLAQDPSIPHPRIAVAFVPDEEIGHGAALLDLEAWGAEFAYTLDAGPLGECAYETFNGVEATVSVRGLSVHTGTAKNLLVNASEVLMEFHGLLPAWDRPEHTEGREGFFYLVAMEGECEKAKAVYILRDHDWGLVEERRRLMEQAAALVNLKHGEGCLELSFREQYRNLKDGLGACGHLVGNMLGAFRDAGVEPFTVPMRGGTDGSQLTYRGLPCPNMSAGYYNAHGCREFAPVPELVAMVDVLEALVRRYARPQGPDAREEAAGRGR